MPRCCPAAYGCAGSKTNGCRTGPSAGHVHALADGREQERGESRREEKSTHASHLLAAFAPALVPCCCLERERLVHGTDGCSLLSNKVTELSQRAAVEVVPGRVRQPRDDLGGDAPRRSGRDELGHGPRAPASGSDAAAPGAEDERDLALRRLGEAAPRARPRLPRTTSSNRFVSSRHTATSRSGVERGERAQRRRQPLRRLERDDRPPPRRASRARARRARPPSAAGSRRTRSAPPASPLATSAVSTADGPGSTVTATPASSAARTSRAPGSEIAGIPASRDERDPLARLEPRHELGDARGLVVLVVGEQPRLDAVPLEQPARVARVLGEHDVGRAQLVEHAQRDVVEVPDRRRADRERHYGRAPRTRPARRRSARPPRRAPRGSISSASPAGASASRSTAEPRRRQQLVERRDAEAAADHDARRGPKMLTSEPIATPRWWPTSSSAGCCCATRSCAVASGPSSSLREPVDGACPSSTPRRGRGRSTRPGTARRPRRSPCGRARSTRGRAGRR